MTFARIYRMTARVGGEAELVIALTALKKTIRVVEGCLGVSLLRDTAAGGAFVFIETWNSVTAYEGQRDKVPKSIFAPVMAALASPPEQSWFEYLLAD